MPTTNNLDLKVSDTYLRAIMLKALNIVASGNLTTSISGDVATDVADIAASLASVILNDYLKNQLFIVKDGTVVPVTLDTSDPYNHTPIPMVLTDVNGSAVVNVTASGLNVKIVHNGSDPSSIRIGDGTDELVINGDGSINTIVSSTDLDIRDLTHTTDSIKIGDGTDLLAVNSDGSINSTTVIPSTIGTILNSDIDVAAEQIVVASTPCKYCIVQAASTNTGNLWIGDSNVTAERGVLLFPTDKERFEIDDVNKLYVYATAVDQSVSVTYFN